MLTRRELIAGALVGGQMRTRPGVFAALAPQRDTDLLLDLLLINGKFVDGRGVVGSALTIKNGRILNVGPSTSLGSGAKTIDLGGRTVIPGFWDAHVHYTRAGVNPGYEARRIERAFSIAE